MNTFVLRIKDKFRHTGEKLNNYKFVPKIEFIYDKQGKGFYIWFYF